MATDADYAAELFKGLKALSDATFPKRCAACGMEYTTVEDYIRDTEDISGQSGLKKGYDDDDKPIVELFRNCPCGSTLMDCFSDRRDLSEAGLKRRKHFGQKSIPFRGACLGEGGNLRPNITCAGFPKSVFRFPGDSLLRHCGWKWNSLFESPSCGF